MSTWPAPTRADHQRFCEREGWRLVRSAQGGTGTHHITYELDLPDGRILRTRVSRPPNRSGYGPGLWAHILRDQLGVDEEQFWACVKDGDLPARGEPAQPAEALPAELVRLLIRRVGLGEAEVAAMTKAQAMRRLDRYWAEGR